MKKYKLYKKLSELFNPSISRDNISRYQIILDNNLIPIEVFYPNKESDLQKVIIYLNQDNNEICQELAIKTDSLVLSVNHDNYSETLKYICDNVNKTNSIAIIYSIENDILDKILKENKNIKKIVINEDTKITCSKDKLKIPNFDSYYSLYNKNELFKIIKEFLK